MSDTSDKNAPLVPESVKGISNYNVYIDSKNGIGVVELLDGDDSPPYQRALRPEQLVELGIGLLTAANHFRDGMQDTELDLSMSGGNETQH